MADRGERIRTLHPQGKSGVNILRSKYVQMRLTILEVLRPVDGLSHSALDAAVHRGLDGTFEGAVSWYMESVKLDLEARGVIQRDPQVKPTAYRLVDKSAE